MIGHTLVVPLLSAVLCIPALAGSPVAVGKSQPSSIVYNGIHLEKWKYVGDWQQVNLGAGYFAMRPIGVGQHAFEVSPKSSLQEADVFDMPLEGEVVIGPSFLYVNFQERDVVTVTT